MGKRSYFVKYFTTKKRAKISSFLPPVPITLFHSFFFQKKKKKVAGETQQYSGILSPRYSQSLPWAVCTHYAPGFLWARAEGFPSSAGEGSGEARAALQRSASRFVLPRITGSPAETHPSGGGTQGGELATGCWKESRHKRMPRLLEDMAGWLFYFI